MGLTVDFGFQSVCFLYFLFLNGSKYFFKISKKVLSSSSMY